MIKNYQQKMIEYLLLENNFSLNFDDKIRKEFIKLFRKFNKEKKQYFIKCKDFYLLLDYDEFRNYSEKIIIAQVNLGKFYSISAGDI